MSDTIEQARKALADAEADQLRGIRPSAKPVIDALRAVLAAYDAMKEERDANARTLYTEGYTPCTAAECNCGSWHGGHVAELRARLRLTAQMLIAETGAGGPMNAEAAAEKAVATIIGLREERDAALLRGVRAGLEAAATECLEVARKYDDPDGGFGSIAADDCKARVAALDPHAIAAEAAKDT